MTQHDRIFDEWLASTVIADPASWPIYKPEKTEPLTIGKIVNLGSSIPVQTKVEKDPNGMSLNQPGAKADAGKNRVHLCLGGFSRALEKVAEVTTIGANKYTPNGWKEVPNGYERYMDAFGRHYLEYSRGKKLDNGPNGTGCEHMAQMIWNLLAAYELSLAQVEKNREMD